MPKKKQPPSERTEETSIATPFERRERLTEILRSEEARDRDVIASAHVMNQMDHIYTMVVDQNITFTIVYDGSKPSLPAVDAKGKELPASGEQPLKQLEGGNE